MKRSLPALAFLSFTLINPAVAEQEESYDYFVANRTMIRNGVQAVLMCNGLFTSGRTIEQVFAQELAYLSEPVGTVSGGEYVINNDLQAVAIGGRNPDLSSVRRFVWVSAVS